MGHLVKLPPLVDLGDAVTIHTHEIAGVSLVGDEVCFAYCVLEKPYGGELIRRINLYRYSKLSTLGSGFEMMVNAVGSSFLEPATGHPLKKWFT